MVRREIIKILLMMIVKKEMIMFKTKIIEIILEAELCRMKIRIDKIVEVGM